MRVPFLSLAACLTVAGCSRAARPAETPAPAAEQAPSVPTPTPTPTPVLGSAGAVREFRGAYTRGFEASWFVPCEAARDDALWWVTLTEDARLQRDSLLKTLTRPATGALAVRWRGTISERMPAGQMGRGTRYMLVHEVLEVRPLPAEGACGVVSRTS
jgi:hypothetical protein